MDDTQGVSVDSGSGSGEEVPVPKGQVVPVSVVVTRPRGKVFPPATEQAARKALRDNESHSDESGSFLPATKKAKRN